VAQPNNQTHYAALGVPENATEKEIRSAYRRLVLRLHPDRTGTGSTTEQFMRVNEAYQVLIDRERRIEYDRFLALRRERETAVPPRQPGWRPPQANPAAILIEAANALSHGNFDRAKQFADQVLLIEPANAIAHAILGDVARSRENLQLALKHYAFAIQFDPFNRTYQRRYEDLFRLVNSARTSNRASAQARSGAAIVVTSLLSGFMLCYVAIARETPMLENVPLISSWSVGLFVMLFVNGVILGSALSMSQTVDRWESVMRSSSGRLAPAAALGLVAVVNFWASALLYVFLGLLQNSFTFSMSRLVTAVAVLTLSYGLMSHYSPTIIASQTVLWGGNVLYVGCLCGWIIADAFR